jgi:hypothetical protein
MNIPWENSSINKYQTLYLLNAHNTTERCILQVDPDKLCIFAKTVFEDSNMSICCMSSAMSMKEPNAYLGLTSENYFLNIPCP